MVVSLFLSDSSGISTTAPLPSSQGQGQDQAEKNRRLIDKNAREYASYLMSTFAKTMLETCDPPNNIDQEIMGTAFMADALGEAMVKSGAGDFIQDDLRASMLEMQGLSQVQGLSQQKKGIDSSSVPKDVQGSSISIAKARLTESLTGGFYASR